MALALQNPKKNTTVNENCVYNPLLAAMTIHSYDSVKHCKK